MKRRDILKLGLFKALLISGSWPLRALSFSAAHIRRARRIAGPLRTTQVMMILSALSTTKTLRSTQVMMVASGKDISKTQRTTQVMMVVAGR
jgi:hypothetical protein